MKKIGVLTSGGDSQGMNSAIRSIVRTGIAHGYEMIGIKRGFNGLMEKDFMALETKDVADILYRGGTFLQSARSKEFRKEEGQVKAANNLREAGIEYLVVIGGDGSYRGAAKLNERDIKTYGLPGTIDNDIPLTDYTIGFDTTLNVVTEAIGNLRDTMSSHDRVSVIEVMGRDRGDIALHAGIASGVDAILIPEIPGDIHKISEKLKDGFERGKTHSIVIVAEGVDKAEKIAHLIKEQSGLDTRATVLGHIQRGGTPSAFDRVFTSRMGHKVIKLMEEGIHGVALGMEKNEITYHSFEEIFQAKNVVKANLYEIFEDLV
ncbi:6-phosphofructokinase [Salipaludibacillus agaradhaerens]|uniref:ATP-dependent 6-phosphofructokinase n=1 Tax=Salipaludibacillus agaradhaerens TaxID=76935 RepID=A0A9Q4B4A2_SALAG|nr:6-phosphofructokinase [Salipaludibacillus agaradhaerens]MCR6097752.1 6-phosphofructokinase [Salipaludibacillus agaradhaerens]MCR6112764.1 6-phosphofructokinase [Salipaludibacillus agaradhaerens]